MTIHKITSYLVLILLSVSCGGNKDQQLKTEIQAINFKQGEIALCGADAANFGTVNFDVQCSEKVKATFNLATALLHSFEYDEAEKVFAKVIEEDPKCVMAYWGVAMSNFHPLWQGKLDLEKGERTVSLARTLEMNEHDSDYLEAIGAFYDGWDKLDHKTRCAKYEEAMENVYKKYPQEKEAAIFYALALDATADPTDKSYAHQRKAGKILEGIYPDNPNHPGIAHYIIHTYDYPELAQQALPQARAYAAIAPASAHAQHMPSHIFTRLGLWDESIQSNKRSIAAAQCYAGNVGMHGHWDEEFHGMDYLMYALLQKGDDQKAKEQLDLLMSYDDPSVTNGKTGYVFASIPARYVVERKQWTEAAALGVFPKAFPWDKYPWESAITHFSRLLGYVHTGKTEEATKELEQLKLLQKKLSDEKEAYKANQVQIQVHAGDAWIHFAQGKKKEAIELMTRAADMEDATAKHPVTPGEIVPARELLGDLLMEAGETEKALQAYETDLKKLPNRMNGLAGAAAASLKLKDTKKANEYYRQMMAVTTPEECKRPECMAAAEMNKSDR
jgi:tetratricopeptide (TPR) repeat protein